jgi:hypothetical protein
MRKLALDTSIKESSISKTSNKKIKAEACEVNEISYTFDALEALKIKGNKSLTLNKISAWFKNNGLNLSDPAFRNILSDYREKPDAIIDIKYFESAFYLHGDLFERLAKKQLAIPNFNAFKDQFNEIFDAAKKITELLH